MKVVYVPWLHMHQPLVWYKNKLVSNIKLMLLSKDTKVQWNAKLITRAYKNPANYIKLLRRQKIKAKIMLDFSGVLLESLKKMRKDLKKIKIQGQRIGDIISLYKEVMNRYPDSIEFAGTAYSHCYFPTTPKEDWKYQIEEWRNVFGKIFGKKELKKVKGFWLPEMGIPGDEDDLAILIKILKDFGYEWIILPIEAVEGEKEMSPEQRIITTSQPHLISAKNESLVAIFRVRYDFIDQQVGCSPEELYAKCLEAGKFFGKVSDKPALVVPASDGENGNTMLNEFFPKTFVPFFRKLCNEKVSSMTVTEFLHAHYEHNGEILPKSKIKVRPVGSSWLATHEPWLIGENRVKVKSEIEMMSKKFHEIKPEKVKSKELKRLYNEAKLFLLIAETSCYVFWGTEFWFNQARKSLQLANERLKKLKKI